jgi:hypothetical protein
MRTILTTATLCALLAIVPRTAFAQDSEDAEITKMAKMHYKAGLDAFKANNFPEAIKELKKAYLLKRLPPLLINIAKTYEKMQDLENAKYYYKKYLAEAPPDAKDRDQIKQTLDDLIAGANKQPEEAPVAATPGTKKNPPPEEAPVAPPPTVVKKNPKNPPPEEPIAEAPKNNNPPPATAPTVSEWTHTPLDAAPPGKPVDVRVQTPVMKGVKMWLYYRGKGQADFTTVEMKRRGQEKVARIPADMMMGKSIQYYIEAKDATGAVVKSSGSQADPNIVMIDASAPPQYASKEGAPEGSEEPTQVEPVPATVEKPSNPDDERPSFNPNDDDKPKKHHDEPTPIPGGGKKISNGDWVKLPMTIAGIAVAAFGVAALAAGVAFAVRANQLASAVALDSCSDPVHEQCTQFLFNDPSASPNDLDFQTQGKLFGYLGPAFIGLGAAAVVAGGGVLIASWLKAHPSAKPVKKIKKRRRRRQVEEPVDDQPELSPRDDSAPQSELSPSDDSAPKTSSIRNLIVTPIAAPSTYGLGVGFSF